MVRYKTEKNQFMEPPAFIPSTTICCSKKIRINPRASQVRIYTENGILEGLNYHGLCKECKMKFYRHWTESKDGYRTYFTEEDEYFMITSSIAFTARYLERISLQICIGATSFDKISEMYNVEFELNDSAKNLNAEVIENHWLVNQLINFCPTILWHRKDHNKHFDIEKICEDVYPTLKKVVDQKWFSHECNETGNSLQLIN